MKKSLLIYSLAAMLGLASCSFNSGSASSNTSAVESTSQGTSAQETSQAGTSAEGTSAEETSAAEDTSAEGTSEAEETSHETGLSTEETSAAEETSHETGLSTEETSGAEETSHETGFGTSSEESEESESSQSESATGISTSASETSSAPSVDPKLVAAFASLLAGNFTVNFNNSGFLYVFAPNAIYTTYAVFDDEGEVVGVEHLGYVALEEGIFEFDVNDNDTASITKMVTPNAALSLADISGDLYYTAAFAAALDPTSWNKNFGNLYDLDMNSEAAANISYAIGSLVFGSYWSLYEAYGYASFDGASLLLSADGNISFTITLTYMGEQANISIAFEDIGSTMNAAVAEMLENPVLPYNTAWTEAQLDILSLVFKDDAADLPVFDPESYAVSVDDFLEDYDCVSISDLNSDVSAVATYAEKLAKFGFVEENDEEDIEDESEESEESEEEALTHWTGMYTNEETRVSVYAELYYVAPEDIDEDYAPFYPNGVFYADFYSVGISAENINKAISVYGFSALPDSFDNYETADFADLSEYYDVPFAASVMATYESADAAEELARDYAIALMADGFFIPEDEEEEPVEEESSSEEITPPGWSGEVGEIVLKAVELSADTEPVEGFDAELMAYDRAYTYGFYVHISAHEGTLVISWMVLEEEYDMDHLNTFLYDYYFEEIPETVEPEYISIYDYTSYASFLFPYDLGQVGCALYYIVDLDFTTLEEANSAAANIAATLTEAGYYSIFEEEEEAEESEYYYDAFADGLYSGFIPGYDSAWYVSLGVDESMFGDSYTLTIEFAILAFVAE